MTKIYTKTGDDGRTSLIGEGRVAKHDPKVNAYGTVDELNSQIAVTIEWLREKPSIWIESLTPELEQIQHELFNLGSQLACASLSRKDQLPSIQLKMIERLELQIDQLQTNLPELKSFIVPGGTMISAQLHVCRTICRRAEREVSILPFQEIEMELKYLNRLSDYFFTAARFVNFNLNSSDVLWRKS